MIKKLAFHQHIVMVGFGAMGKALLPLLLRHLDLKPAQFTLITNDDENKEIALEYGLDFRVNGLTSENHKKILEPLLHSGDMLLNMSVDVSTVDLIKVCNAAGAMYLDLSIEPWAGVYLDPDLPTYERTNYVLRENTLALKDAVKPTAILTHGANPGLVSHLVKQALLNIAKDNDLEVATPKTSQDWARLSNSLGIKAIHVAERDTQIIDRPYNPKEFVNTWSVDGLINEGLQPAEIGWGTHERQLPALASEYEFGCKAAIYLEKSGIDTKVRTWTPSLGAFHGYMITHAETVTLANYLTLKEQEQVVYRPTVHYAYLPSPYAILSINQFIGSEYELPALKRVLLEEITEGYDELGVLLMGNKKGAYWYGSTLNIHEARALAPYNSATSLQVVASALASILWAIENPNKGLVEPEDIDYEYILEIARPYLGTVSGHYTDWTPLDNRALLFDEELDKTDPWQFSNIIVK